MKNRLYLGACVFLLLMQGMAVCNAQNKDFANLKRYAESNRVLQQEQSGTVKGRVVFMGNSITEGRGISGQTSYQFLLRFREDVIKLKPEVVVINAGTNDVAENTGPYVEEYTFGNIVSMVELARANDIKVVLTSVLPAAAFGWLEQDHYRRSSEDCRTEQTYCCLCGRTGLALCRLLSCFVGR